MQPGLKETVIKQITTELADKGKNKGDARAGSLGALKALVAKFGATAECVVLPMLGAVLEALADKLKPVSMEAEKVVDAILASMSPHAVMGITPTVLAERDGKWQSNLGRAKMLKEMAEKFPKQMNRVLTSVMPVVSGLMWDTKPQVKDTAAEAMNKSARRRHAAKRAPQHNKIAAAPLSPLAPHFSPSFARLRVRIAFFISHRRVQQQGHYSVDPRHHQVHPPAGADERVRAQARRLRLRPGH